MRASESMQRKQAENLEKGCLSVKPWREKGNHEWDKLIKELFLTLTPPKKGIFWGKRQAKKQRLARFFEKSVAVTEVKRRKNHKSGRNIIRICEFSVSSRFVILSSFELYLQICIFFKKSEIL